MQSNEIRRRYLEFFKKRGHVVIPSASLLPENDPSSLFITAGMQPLVPYLLGEKHPAGTRIVDIQKCIRTGDIDDVGDNRHLTFFEMMGNWSLGDYFKEEAIKWSLEFLTNKEEGLGLEPSRLYATVFKGENGIPRDNESIEIWKNKFAKHDINAEVADSERISGNIRIIPLGVDDNFWIAGQAGPCGGDTEIFYDTVGGKLEGDFSDLVKSGRIIEVWNNVFMEFNKTADGKYEPLAKKNVDTGMGLERTAVVMQGKSNVFETDIFEGLIKKIKLFCIDKDNLKSQKIVADHIKSAVFIINEGIVPSNTEAGYVLRKLLRRTLIHLNKMQVKDNTIDNLLPLTWTVIEDYKEYYPELEKNKEVIRNVIGMEQEKFSKTLKEGIKQIENIAYKIEGGQLIDPTKRTKMTGVEAFNLHQSYGFPIELTKELCEERNILFTDEEFGVYKELFKKHQEISKVGSEQKFKGGLASTGEMETKYHTTTHLLLASLRQVLGADIVQKGSNITSERLRFDFNWPEKLTKEQIQKVEDLVNQKIQEGLPIEMVELPKEEAKKIVTTLSFDLSKYGDIVKVYKIGDFSAEFCGGPHVKNTNELGKFKIVKEEASSAGVRRIKAVLS